MNTIELSVGGQTYAIACEAGEEDHIRQLGEAIDAKFVQMGPRYAQNLLFAALQLADELHEARKASVAVETDKRKLQDGFDAYRTETAAKLRDADTVQGQSDVMKARIAELETELGRMQSSQQSAAKETDGIRKEVSDLREKEADLEGSEKLHLAKIASLTEELEKALSVSPEPTAQNAAIRDPDFPPALERFAQLLEETADKLEEKAGHS